ncbi:MAG: TIR domain-containing protein [Gammaproteobacteria bacterium]|nr:TIR domain-containing protein [Gammaproteobacteria bacterium]
MQAEALQSKLVSESVRAFLSFTTEDKPLVDAFRAQIGLQHPQVELLDHAVTDSYEEDWKRECARKIGRSAMLICLVGAKTHRSEAVAWEIDHGLSLGKRIVAVNLTAAGVRVPDVLVRNAIKPQQGIAGMALTSASAPVLEREAHGHSG